MCLTGVDYFNPWLIPAGREIVDDRDAHNFPPRVLTVVFLLTLEWTFYFFDITFHQPTVKSASFRPRVSRQRTTSQRHVRRILLVKAGMLRGLARSPEKRNAVLLKSGNKRSTDSHD